MQAFNSITDLMNGVTSSRQEDSTLPYEIRAEIDWIDFSCTANPLGTPPNVMEAISKAITEGDLAFLPDRNGSHLASVLSRYYEISQDSFLVGTSVPSMISAVAQAYRPCNVGIPSPAPSEYFLSVANVGHNPLKLMNPFSLSAIEPQTAFSNGLKFEAAVLANPSFPCARLLSESTLKRYMEACNWVIIDESNIMLTLGGESFISLTQKYKNLLVIRSLSIELGIPGIPMGYVVGHPDTIKHIRQFSDGLAISMFHEIVAKEIPNTTEYSENTIKLLDTEIPWMQCMLSLTPGIKVFPSEANFVMCALEKRAVRDFGISSADELIVRLQKAGYTVGDLEGIPGIEGQRYFLVAIRTHEENKRFIAALRNIISQGNDDYEMPFDLNPIQNN